MALLSRRAKWSGSVTLPAANTNYQLRDLINAVLASAGAEIPDGYRELNIQAFGGIDGASGNTNDILIGDSLMTTSNFGFDLQPGTSRLYRSTFSNGFMCDIWVRSAGTAQVLNVDYVSS